MEPIFITSNKNKLREARDILGFRIKHRIIDIEEIQSTNTKEVAISKAKAAYEKLDTPVVVEDTGLHILGFGGFPGALVKWMTEGLGYEKMCRVVDLCKSRDAYAETCIAYYDGENMHTFTGHINGSISEIPRGSSNFGWDCIFIPEGFDKTFAQMHPSEKNSISMRREAFTKLGKFMASRR